MDPNLDLDVVSLDKGIADLEATGTSTWDFQTQDCDPLSLAERLKALKERDTALLLTSGPSNSAPQPQGACKAARYCYVPNVSTWGNLQPNTLYTRPDGLWGRLQFTKFADLDIIFNPYLTMLCASASSSKSISSQTTSYTVNITREGGDDANLEKNVSILLPNGKAQYGSQTLASPCCMNIHYPGTGATCTISIIFTTANGIVTNPAFPKGKSLFIRPNFCCYPMYYGTYQHARTVTVSTTVGTSTTTDTYTNYGNRSCLTEPVSRVRIGCKLVHTIPTSSTTYYNGGDQDGYKGFDVSIKFPFDDARDFTDLVETVSLGQRFSENVYNIPQEWQVL